MADVRTIEGWRVDKDEEGVYRLFDSKGSMRFIGKADMLAVHFCILLQENDNRPPEVFQIDKRGLNDTQK